MNERIKELVEQCYEKHELLGTYEFNKEKFAELIVRECLAKCDQSGIYASKYDVADAIKDYFGVQ